MPRIRTICGGDRRRVRLGDAGPADAARRAVHLLRRRDRHGGRPRPLLPRGRSRRARPLGPRAARTTCAAWPALRHDSRSCARRVVRGGLRRRHGRGYCAPTTRGVVVALNAGEGPADSRSTSRPRRGDARAGGRRRWAWPRGGARRRSPTGGRGSSCPRGGRGCSAAGSPGGAARTPDPLSGGADAPERRTTRGAAAYPRRPCPISRSNSGPPGPASRGPLADVEGKIARALDALGPLAGRDVRFVDLPDGCPPRGSASPLGSRRPTPVETARDHVRGREPRRGGLAVDGFRGVATADLAEADRALRPGGRLLVVHDYGRDDVSALHDPQAPEYRIWSRVKARSSAAGFKIRVVHCFWTFPGLDAARAGWRRVRRAGRDGRGRPEATEASAGTSPIYHRWQAGEAPEAGAGAGRRGRRPARRCYARADEPMDRDPAAARRYASAGGRDPRPRRNAAPRRGPHIGPVASPRSA